MRFKLPIGWFGPKSISRDEFVALRAMSPKRQICGPKFLKRANGPGPAYAFLSPKFKESFSVFSDWPIEAKSGRYGTFYSYTVKSEATYNQILAWLSKFEGLVLIRSLMDSAIALDLHQSEPGVHTAIGNLEYRAKFQGDGDAEEEIAQRLAFVIRELHLPLGVDAVCSVPASTAGSISLPNRLAARVASILKIPDLTSAARWNGSKSSIKETAVNEKWDALDEVGLSVDPILKGKSVVLIDDLYQSGSTLHFLASKLYSAGVAEVHSVAVVKALSDTDNT